MRTAEDRGPRNMSQDKAGDQSFMVTEKEHVISTCWKQFINTLFILLY